MSDGAQSDFDDRSEDMEAKEGEFEAVTEGEGAADEGGEPIADYDLVPSDGTYADAAAHGDEHIERGGSDATLILEAAMSPAEPLMVPMRWDAYGSAHHIGIELKHLEDEVRVLLDPIDPRRKRKFSGTRRWHELEDDLRALRFSGRLAEETIVKILQMIAKRHTLYQRLSFLSSTRPTWNT